jgi:hypothetical protein
MDRTKRLQSERNGFAMALVIVSLIILFITGIGLLSLGMHSRSFAVKTCSGIAARSAADAGLTKALFEMNEKLKTKPWDDSNLPFSINEPLVDSDAVFSYKVIGDRNNGYTIVSVGKYGEVEKQVSCDLMLEGPFDTAIYGSDLISLKSGTTIDGYNYTKPGECLKIGTNSILPSRVIARSGVTIKGDVFCGPGGDPDIVIDTKLEAVITGTTFALDEAFEMPSVELPKFLQTLPSIGNITNSMTLTGPTRCESVSLMNKILVIDGPVDLYCNGNFSLDVLSRVVVVDATINPNAYLNLYLNGDFMAKNSSSVNNTTKDPRKLKVYGLDKCKSFQYLINSIFYGAIYAPNAEVALQYEVEIYGAVLGKQLTQQVAANFHYDASLKEGCVSDEMVTFVIKQWYEN